jgi:hypothetical protein
MNTNQSITQKSPTHTQLTTNLSHALLKQLIPEQNPFLTDNLVPELIDHIQKFLDSKNRHSFTSTSHATTNHMFKKSDPLCSSIQESVTKSTGRTQTTEIKKQKWVWKEEGETHGSKTFEKEYMSKDDNESLLVGEDIKGIQELQNHMRNAKKLDFKKGVEISNFRRKKNRFSMPAKTNKFGHNDMMIEEECEEESESKGDGEQSQRNLEESLRMLKGHLVKEIEESEHGSGVKMSNGRVNLYSGAYTCGQNKEICEEEMKRKNGVGMNLDYMLKQSLYDSIPRKNDNTIHESKEKSKTRESNKLSFERQGLSFAKKKESTLKEKIEEDPEPKTRELFFDPNKHFSKIRKSASLKNSFSRKVSMSENKDFSSKFTPKKQKLKQERMMRLPEELHYMSVQGHNVMSNPTWQVTRASGYFQKDLEHKKGSQTIFDKLYQRSRIQHDAGIDSKSK